MKHGTKNTSQKEIEFKWRAQSKIDFERFRYYAKALGASASRSQTLRIRDLYLDTLEGQFAKTGLKCRLRQYGSEWQLTLKSFARLKKGLAQRLEKEIKLPAFKTRAAALRYVKGRLEASLLSGAPLRKLFEIKNLRTLCRYKLPERAIAEASFDRVTLSRNKKKVAMLEIEFEFLSGDLASFKKFARALTSASGLKPQKKSKVATALSAFSLKRLYRKNFPPPARAFRIMASKIKSLVGGTT